MNRLQLTCTRAFAFTANILYIHLQMDANIHTHPDSRQTYSFTSLNLQRYYEYNAKGYDERI